MDENILKNIPGIDAAQTITTIDAEQLTPKMFIEYFVSNNRPCLIKGAVKHWPAIKKWRDPDYLKAKCGDSPTTYYPHMNYDHTDNMKVDETVKPFSFVLDILCHPSSDITSAPSLMFDKPPFLALAKDVAGFSFLPSPPKPLLYPASRSFMYKGAGTGWHYHFVDETLMCQVIGSKKVGLLPPDTETDNIVYDAFTTDAYLSNGDCFDPTTASKLKPMLAIVEPGDALYIPPFWWHGVETIGSSFGITVANCWRSPLHVMGDLSFPTVRKIWKKSLTRPNKRTPFVLALGISSLLMQSVRFIFNSRARKTKNVVEEGQGL